MGAPRRVNSAQQGKLDTLAAISAEERVFRDNAYVEFEAMLRDKQREFDVRKSMIIHELRASGGGVRPVPHQTIQRAANAINWRRYNELMSATEPGSAVEPVDVPDFFVGADGTLEVNWWLDASGSRVDSHMTGKWSVDAETLSTSVSMDRPEWDSAVRELWFANNVAPRIIEEIGEMS